MTREDPVNAVRPDFVSVVVPCLNEEKYLPELFEALQRQVRPL